MTPEQIQEAEETAALFDRCIADQYDYSIPDTKAALAARCIRACIEASKEENWALYDQRFGREGGVFRLCKQRKFFTEAITGEPS